MGEYDPRPINPSGAPRSPVRLVILLVLAVGLGCLGTAVLTLHRARPSAADASGERPGPARDPEPEPERRTDCAGPVPEPVDAATLPGPPETLHLANELLVGDREARRNATRQLAALQDPAAAETLRHTFAASDEPHCAEMAEDLAALRTPVALQVLRLALDDKRSRVKEPVLVAMERRDSPERAELVICALGSTDEWVRLKAVMASYGLADRRLVPLLRKAVDDKGRGIGSKAAEMLGAVGGPEAQPALIELLTHPDWTVRHGAVFGLSAACAKTGYGEEALSGLLATLAREEGGQTYQVRFVAAVVLAGVKTPRVRDALIAQLQVETYELPRNRILEVLAKTFADDAVAQAVVKKPPPMPARDTRPPPPPPIPAPPEVF